MPLRLMGAALLAVDAMKSFEQLGQLFWRHADARIFHRERGTLRRHAQGELRRLLEGELERIGEQVQDDLLPHLPIDEDRLGQRRAVDALASSDARVSAERNVDASSAVSVARSVGRNFALVRPASMREKSSSAFTSRNSRSELRWAALQAFALAQGQRRV